MSTTTEKPVTGFVMTSTIKYFGGNRWAAIVYQDGRCVHWSDGCSSKQHAEQIARDIMVRYALVERPTI